MSPIRLASPLRNSVRAIRIALVMLTLAPGPAALAQDAAGTGPETTLPPLPPERAGPEGPPYGLFNRLRTLEEEGLPPADPPVRLLPPGLLRTPVDPPNGFTGPSGVLPREPQQVSDFVPVEDRWRVGFPEWDRDGRDPLLLEDRPFMRGRLADPFNQNVLKGDYPIIGQHTFLDVSFANLFVPDYRRVPTQTTPFESTDRAGEFGFFGRFDQFGMQNFTTINLDLFHGDTAFKPFDWKVRIQPVFNVNNLSTSELAQVSPNVLQGSARTRTFWTVQEYFVERKIADLGPNYDFMSARVGSQFFVSDFRGLIFADVNRAVRIFGTRNANRDQFNLAYFRQAEKDTNSGLNTFNDRRQNILIANYFRQDFIWPGYTAQLSFHYNNDPPRFLFNKNRFLVRPDPVGIFQPHEVNAYYLGWAGDGHIHRINISHAFYWVVGRDSMNPLANRPQNISAQLGALELSYDRDWMRLRTAFLFASGDGNINNGTATGFDSILAANVFAGGIFAHLQRQALPLFGVNLFNNLNSIPNLRSSTIQGQSNFVNPGLLLFNLGQDMELTPKLKMINNANFLWYDDTNVLKQYLYAGRIHRAIGVDMSSGFEYRPLLSDNLSTIVGVGTLLPGLGFKDIYSNYGRATETQFSMFAAVTVVY